jgi:poly(3-hydroxybutyrate) depolymerase
MKLPLYMWYEATHAMLGPARALAGSTKLFYNNPANPLSHSPFGRGVAAACEMFERTTRRYGKPEFGYGSISVNGVQTEIVEDVLHSREFPQDERGAASQSTKDFDGRADVRPLRHIAARHC